MIAVHHPLRQTKHKINKALGRAQKGKCDISTATEIAAMGVEQDEIVSSFVVVTGASDAQARFFLESTDWELEAALISFFEAVDVEGVLVNSGVEEEEMRVPESGGGAGQQQRRDRQGAGAWGGRSTGSTQEQGMVPSSSPFNGKEQGSGKSGSSSRGGITTLSDLSRQPDSDGDSDEGPQEYYTGGEKRLALIPKKMGPPSRRCASYVGCCCCC